MRLIYLHGFRSTPNSAKARLLREQLSLHAPEIEFVCPALPASPQLAIALIEEFLHGAAVDDVSLVGSSLGGFYATYLAERYGFRAVLLNPAITPQRDLKKYLGEQTVYGSSQTIVVQPEFLEQLESIAVAAITRPERYFLIAATGDELIDWRDMTAKYQGAAMQVIQGSDHGLSDFDDYVEVVIDFARER